MGTWSIQHYPAEQRVCYIVGEWARACIWLSPFRPGYVIAWFTSPTRSLGDAQINAEYIAYNIKRLAQMSSTGKVFIIGHSQGNINIQWALAFWPSTTNYVSGFSSLAGDFHGKPTSFRNGHVGILADIRSQVPPRARSCVLDRTYFREVASLASSSRVLDHDTWPLKMLVEEPRWYPPPACSPRTTTSSNQRCSTPQASYQAPRISVSKVRIVLPSVCDRADDYQISVLRLSLLITLG